VIERRLGCQPSAAAIRPHAAVGAEREDRHLASPFGGGLLGRPGLRRAQAEARCDGAGDVAQLFLAALDIQEGSARRLLQRDRVEIRDIGDVRVGPAVQPAPDIARDARLLGLPRQPRHLHAFRRRAQGMAVDHRVAQHGAAGALDQPVDGDARHLVRLGHDRRVLVEDAVRRLAHGLVADDAAAAGVQDGACRVCRRRPGPAAGARLHRPCRREPAPGISSAADASAQRGPEQREPGD
jgi:hypothetical protein